MPDYDDPERREVSREEFIAKMPPNEDEGAGPDAPETMEPGQGQAGAGSVTTGRLSALGADEADRLSARRTPAEDPDGS